MKRHRSQLGKKYLKSSKEVKDLQISYRCSILSIQIKLQNVERGYLKKQKTTQAHVLKIPRGRVVSPP